MYEFIETSLENDFYLDYPNDDIVQSKLS